MLELEKANLKYAQFSEYDEIENFERQKLYSEILRNDLDAFVEKSFYTTNPGTELIPNWHIEMMCEYLRAVENGEIKRLIINIPPRHLKSHVVTCSWPAWLLGHNPNSRVICASYSQQIANRHSLDSRRIMQSEWYQNLFPDTEFTKDQNQKYKFNTTENGFRFATSVGGSITGEGADYLILDDPHNPVHISSKTKRHYVHDWFEQNFITRLNDKKTGAIIIIMQRLHPNDLTGYLLDKGLNWDILKIPAIAPNDLKYNINNKDYHFQHGELLCKEREGIEDLNNLKEELGSYNFAAQYQQEPLDSKLGVIKPEWITYISNDEFNNITEQNIEQNLNHVSDNQRSTSFKSTNYKGRMIIQSWDTAFKTNTKSDYSVCVTAMVTDNSIIIYDVFRAKLEYNDLIRKVHDMNNLHSPDVVLIEDKAAGQSVIQEIARNSKIPFIPIQPKQDKLTRLMQVSGYFESGRVKILERAHWTLDFIQELLNFPNYDHDDQVDATTQLILYCKNKREDKKASRWV